ncbi:MAG TPA: FAD-dependent monooxygenase [Kofleriaceae bacterium]|nr:FAD-dependent monooxygenase [Kofleriaceae bacterium]
MTRHHTVLIIGAGPCGLMTACELRRRGIAADILDGAAEAQRGSRAILLWPPSLRLYRDLGVLADAERRGVTIRALSYFLGPGRSFRLPLAPAMAPLILPQEDTDALLDGELRRLGGSVEWGRTLTAITQTAGRVSVELRHADGTRETRTADWVIGADGFKSATRELLGIAFAGERLPTTFLLAEGKIAGDYDREAVNYYLSRAGVVLVAPLPGGRVRISAPLPAGEAVRDDTTQRMLDERVPGGLRVVELDVNTSFTSHERIAARLRAGRCFLVGDAAHTHSVVGGQGLNLGFGDARNLAWKLAGVIERRLDARILDSYDVERRAAAEQVVQATGRMARQAVMGPVAAWMRNTLFSAAHRSGVLGKKLPPLLAGWAIRYPQTLIARGGKRAGFLPPAGACSPEWTLARADADRDRFELVTVGPEHTQQRTQAAQLVRAHSALVSHRHVVAGQEGFLLLRPDGFVAASGRRGDLGWLGDAFATLAVSHKEMHE